MSAPDRDENPPVDISAEDVLAVWSGDVSLNSRVEELYFFYTQQFQAELEASGIWFASNSYGWDDVPEDEAEAIRRSEIIGQRARNSIMLLDVVATKVDEEIKGPDITESEKSIAKRLVQAHLLASGYNGPWFELVDRELSGTGYELSRVEDVVEAIQSEDQLEQDRSDEVTLLLPPILEALGLTDEEIMSPEFIRLFPYILILARKKSDCDKANESRDYQRAGSIIDEVRRMLVNAELFSGNWVTTFNALFSD